MTVLEFDAVTKVYSVRGAGQIKALDDAIAEQLARHADAQIFTSLPRSGTVRAARLLSEIGVDGYFLEYDDERSGGFAPLRFLPKGKKVVLGLVSSKYAPLEPKDALKRRIDEAS